MNTKTLPHIPLTPVESSQITHLGYHPETNTLAIQFKNKEGKPGSIYRYQNVSQKDFDALRKAESIGGHFGKHIKSDTKKFPFTKVSP